MQPSLSSGKILNVKIEATYFSSMDILQDEEILTCQSHLPIYQYFIPNMYTTSIILHVYYFHSYSNELFYLLTNKSWMASTIICIQSWYTICKQHFHECNVLFLYRDRDI